MDMVLAVMMGIGLSAACGFRVFVPLLVLSIAARSGAVSVSSDLAFLGSTEALIALATASVLEIVAYKVPWLDHVLDTVATPAAVIAGTIVTASQVGQVTFNGVGAGPLLQWGLAIIAGGGAAAAVQTVSVATRAASTVMTGGLGNPIISTGESIMAVAASVVAVIAPVLAIVLVAVVLVVGVRVVQRWRRSRTQVVTPAMA